MAKKRKGKIGSVLKRKATNSAKQTAYMLLFWEEPPKGKRKTK